MSYIDERSVSETGAIAVIERLKQFDRFALYGAQVVAYGAYTAIRGLTGRVPMCFAVGRPQGMTFFPTGNPTEIDGIPVRLIEEVETDTFIIVAVTELVQREVLPMLAERGYREIFALTQHEEHQLMAAYYRSIGRFPMIGDKHGFYSLRSEE